MKPKAFLMLLPVTLALLLAGVGLDGVVATQTGRTLISHALPSREAEPVAIAPVVEVEEEIPLDELPESYWAWHLSLFLDDDWEQQPDQVALVQMFSEDARLRRLKRQVHDHVYTPSNPLFASRYAKSIARLPAVRLQRDDGKVIYQVGNHIPVPGTAKALGNDIARAIREMCPRPRPRPQPQPEPEPKPSPNPTPIPDMPIIDRAPDVEPDRVDEEEEGELAPGQIIGIGAVVLLASAATAALLAARKDVLGG